MSTATSTQPPRATTLPSRARNMRAGKALRRIWCSRLLFLLTIGILVPLFVAIFYSFTDLTLRIRGWMVGFQNYHRHLRQSGLLALGRITIRYAFIATAVEMVLACVSRSLLNHESAFAVSAPGAHFPLMIATRQLVR